VFVTPCLITGFNIRIQGQFSAYKEDPGLKEYIGDVFWEVLNKEV